MATLRPPPPNHFLFTSESVNEGHPDKLCDQVSDAILDACLAQDPESKVACEACAKTGMVMVFGEITTKAVVAYDQVVRDTVKVTVEYEDCDGVPVPRRVHTIVISTQHAPDACNERLRSDLMRHVVLPVVPARYLDENTIYHLNPSGKFIIGGPHADAGLTGRKIIIDTYGGWGAHGGGAFSGKDSTKVDRSAAYAARQAAKSLVANGFCKRCCVQVSYSIGLAQPLSMFVNSYNTAKLCGYTDAELLNILMENFDFRPGVIQRQLRLTEPRFKRLAAYGHFGRSSEECTWEQVVDLSHCKRKMKGNADVHVVATGEAADKTHNNSRQYEENESCC
ncbi:UNVERIFIED_CONTAM: hypothetical protein H355_003396 [Colinus virginianus]|nr:hypothetical protein H355_003396 [Colinus virginianus]